MSDDTLPVIAIVSLLAVAAALWSSIRRRQLEQRVRRSLDEARQRKVVRPAPNVVDALTRVVTELETAMRLLEEISVIGLWSKSDDSSDQRRKRQGLREMDWAVSGALRALTELRSHQPDLPAPLRALEEDLRALVGVLEPLPDTVTDWMGENGRLDLAISDVSKEISRLMARASDLAAESVAGRPDAVSPQ